MYNNGMFAGEQWDIVLLALVMFPVPYRSHSKLDWSRQLQGEANSKLEETAKRSNSH